MTETLVEMLQRGESRERGYNDYNRYAPRPGGPGHFRGADTPIDFSQMTIGEIQRNQDLSWNHRDKLHAVGRYQIIGDTLEEAIAGMRLQQTDRFTPELQDRILVDYLMDEKRPDIRGYITGREGVTLREAQTAMSNEWASVAHPGTGRSVYPNNHATITPTQSSDALQNARAQYAQAIAAGQTPEAAWRAAAGLGQQQQVQSQTQDGQTPRPGQTERSQSRDAIADGVLRQGERGADVKGLQESLNTLGIKDANGNRLAQDSDYGKHTKEAVENFQRANGLKVDGIAGKDTLTAIGNKLPEGKVTVDASGVTGPDAKIIAQDKPVSDKPDTDKPLISDAKHPNHALFEAISAKLPAGTKPEVAANITLQSLENGITGPDKLARVDISGSDAFVQGSVAGDRAKVDLTAPTPTLQQMSDHMAQQSQLASQQQSQQQQRTQILQ